MSGHSKLTAQTRFPRSRSQGVPGKGGNDPCDQGEMNGYAERGMEYNGIPFSHRKE